LAVSINAPFKEEPPTPPRKEEWVGFNVDGASIMLARSRGGFSKENPPTPRTNEWLDLI